MSYGYVSNSHFGQTFNGTYNIGIALGGLVKKGFFEVPSVIPVHTLSLNGLGASNDPVVDSMELGDVDDPSQFTVEAKSFGGIYSINCPNCIVIQLTDYIPVEFQFELPVSVDAATDKAAIATGFKDLFDDFIAGSDPPAGSRVIWDDDTLTYQDIVAKFQTKFAALGFTDTSGVFKAVCSADGAVNNEIAVTTFIRNSMPTTLVEFTSANKINYPALIHGGLQVDLKVNRKGKVLEVPTHSSRFSAGRHSIGSEFDFSITLQQGRNYNFQAIAEGIWNVSNTNTRNAIMPGGRQKLLTYGLLAWRNGIIGGREVLAVYNFSTEGFENNFSPEGIPQVTLNGKAQVTAGREDSGDPVAIQYIDARAA